MSDAPKQDLVMSHLVSLRYEEPLSRILDRFVDGLIEGRILGHRCPSC